MMATQNDPVDENTIIFSNTVAALCFGFFVVALLLMYWAEPYPVVWRYSMFLNAPNSLLLASFIALICVVTPLNKWVLKRFKMPNDFGHNFTAYFMFGLPVLLTFTQLGLIVNGVLDRTEPQTHQTVVVSNRVSRPGKGGTHWYLNVRDWHNPTKTIQITVPRHRYETTSLGSPMQVTTKTGFLGYEWIISHS